MHSKSTLIPYKVRKRNTFICFNLCGRGRGWFYFFLYFLHLLLNIFDLDKEGVRTLGIMNDYKTKQADFTFFE